MRGRHRSVALVLSLLGVPATAYTDGWVEIRSPSFVVATDGGEREARRVVLQFEQVRALIREVWP